MKSYEAKRSRVRRALKKIVDNSPSHIPFTRVGSKLLVFFSKGWEFVVKPQWNSSPIESEQIESLFFSVRILRTSDGVEKIWTIYDSVDLVVAHLYAWEKETV